ncbi:unnamed protein product, partial [Rhizoctonia solani]
DRMILARSLNAAALGDAAELYPLPLPGGHMPGEVFPATVGSLRALTGQELDHLIHIYNIVADDTIPQLVDQRRKVVAQFFGVRSVG